MKKKYLSRLKAYNPNQIDAEIVLSANESTNYLFEEGVLFQKDTAKYPEANADSLRELLADKWGLDKSNFIVGNGSTELLELVVKTYVNPQENVLTFSPSFSMYDIYATIYNANIVKVQIDTDGTMNMNKFIQNVIEIDPKVVFLCTPNNPTGGMVSRDEIIGLLDVAKGIVVVDEAYMDFAFDSETVINLVKDYPNLIVARTFSKAYGLAAYRLGYLVSCAERIDELISIKLPYNVNQASIEVGKEALCRVVQVQKFIEEVIEIRDDFSEKLKTLRFDVLQSFGNFVFVRSECNLYEILLDNNVLIRSFQNNTYRITIGSKQQMKKVFEVLKEAIK